MVETKELDRELLVLGKDVEPVEFKMDGDLEVYLGRSCDQAERAHTNEPIDRWAD